MTNTCVKPPQSTWITSTVFLYWLLHNNRSCGMKMWNISYLFFSIFWPNSLDMSFSFSSCCIFRSCQLYGPLWVFLPLTKGICPTGQHVSRRRWGKVEGFYRGKMKQEAPVYQETGTKSAPIVTIYTENRCKGN